jgi:hypothetical protein
MESTTIECPECEGERQIEMLDCTMGSSSMCCGGCYKYVPCTECEGNGEIEKQ